LPRPKLDAEQFALSIAPQMFALLLDLAEEIGVTPQRLCAGLGCSAADLRRGQEISNRQAWRMIRRALQLTGRADLGLELGTRQNLSHFGLPGFAMSAARTLGEAAEICIRYHKQGGGGAIRSAGRELDGDLVSVTVHSNLRDDSVLPFVVEEFFASGLTIARLLVGDRFRLHSVELAYPEPMYSARYRQIFDCPVHFGCARNRVRIERRFSSLPIATHSAVLVALQIRLLEEQARGKTLPPRTTVAVEQLLLRSGKGRLSIDQVAGALQVSVRTLRRRLLEDGSSFRALCERIRLESAQRLLREQGVTVAAAAERLGYSDARAFRRAYKRWLGQVPGKTRWAANPGSTSGE
jgi:AraC-like DNA-binding protein